MGMIRGLFKLIGYIIRCLFNLITLVLLIGVGVFIYARYIEPQLLIVKEKPIVAKSIRLEGQAVKIVQLSDLHLGPHYDMNKLQRVVDKINAIEPDILIFTGDLIDDNKTFTEAKETIEKLSQLKAKLGKYAVFGNHDHGGNGTKRYRLIMEESGFNLLVNEHEKITLKNGQKINIMGIDDMIFGEPSVEEATKGIDKKDYNLFVSHAPDVADEVAKYPIDLQISGHSHGGQVTIPGINIQFTPMYAKKYIKGMYKMENNSRMQLYVNVGIGTSQLPYRFFNIPEITLFTLENQ